MEDGQGTSNDRLPGVWTVGGLGWFIGFGEYQMNETQSNAEQSKAVQCSAVECRTSRANYGVYNA
jgi:hypothetical protein